MFGPLLDVESSCDGRPAQSYAVCCDTDLPHANFDSNLPWQALLSQSVLVLMFIEMIAKLLRDCHCVLAIAYQQSLHQVQIQQLLYERLLCSPSRRPVLYP